VMLGSMLGGAGGVIGGVLGYANPGSQWEPVLTGYPLRIAPLAGDGIGVRLSLGI
jgi:hypothetical protein